MVSQWKIKEVEELAENISNSKIIALVNISNIPSKQMQKMRKNLRGKAKLKISRNNLIKLAFDKAKVKDMYDYVEGSTGMIFSDVNPFKLKKTLDEGKTNAPIKPGQTAPKDIIVPEGDTPLPPGPIISELQQAGIKAKIEGGKIVIMEDSVAAKKGEEVSVQVASVLTRLGIEPLEISLEIKAAYEDGVIYTPGILEYDESRVTSDIERASQNAINFSLNSNIYNEYTVKVFLQKAFSEAKNLALNAGIINKGTIEYLLSKANTEMLSLKSQLKLEDVEEGNGKEGKKDKETGGKGKKEVEEKGKEGSETEKDKSRKEEESTEKEDEKNEKTEKGKDKEEKSEESEKTEDDDEKTKKTEDKEESEEGKEENNKNKKSG